MRLVQDEPGHHHGDRKGRSSSTNYTVDALNRIVRVDYDDSNVLTYAYDDNGNRLFRNESTGVQNPRSVMR